jgi:hypothetical protein
MKLNGKFARKKYLNLELFFCTYGVPDCLSFIWRLNLATKIADEQQIVSLFCTNSRNSVKNAKI